MNKTVDTTFGIKEQALAVLHSLSSLDLEDMTGDDGAGIATFPWYNGRERGVCLMVAKAFLSRECLLITFGECRSSDSLFVDAWTAARPFNAPDVSLFTDEAYARRRTFDYMRVDLAREHILTTIEKYLKGVDHVA